MEAIANQKREENIAEYLLYMWQAEDTVRACGFDPERLEEQVLDKIPEGEERERSRIWYRKLMAKMKEQGLQVSGHIREVEDLMSKLLELQHALLTKKKDEDFAKLYQQATTYLHELRKKSDKVPRSDVETALNGLYGVLLLRLQKKPVNAETDAAAKVLGKYMGYLAARFKQYEKGELDL